MFAVMQEDVYFLITDDLDLAEAYAHDMFQRKGAKVAPIELIDYETKQLIFSLADSASFNLI